MHFVKSSLWAGLVIAFKAVGNILVNKLISVYYQSPQTFALLAHFQNLLGIYSSIPADGINQGVIKYTSDKTISKEEASAIFNAGLILNGFIFVLSILSIFVFKDYFISVFSQGLSPYLWLVLIACLLLFHLMNMYFLAQLLSRQNLKAYAGLTIASVALGVFLVAFSLINLNFSLVLIAVGVGPSSLFFVSMYLVHKYYYPLFALKMPKPESLKKLGGFIAMALSIMFFGRVVDFIVREYAMSQFSVYETGLWQSVVKFSDYYMGAFVSLIGMVYFPKISELITDKSQLQKYVHYVLKVIVPVSALGLILVYILRSYILVFFFDEQFIAGEKYFTFQLTGDLLKMISYVLGFIIIAEARTGLFIATQAFSAICYIALLFICTNLFDMEGFPIAHTIRYILFTGLIVVIYRKLLFS